VEVIVVDKKANEGPARPTGMPMAMQMGGGSGFGGVMMMGGMDRLTPEEQEQFKRLLTKMQGNRPTPTPGMNMGMGRNPFNPEGREGPQPPRGGERRPEGRSPEGRQPNLEERLERLERAIDEIRQNLKKK
jgi:hypothetical protein